MSSTQPNRTVYFHCDDPAVVATEIADELLESLRAAEDAVDIAGDLPALVARGDERLARWARDPHVRIASWYAPRAVRWLFAAAEAPRNATAETIPLAGMNAPAARAAILPDAPPHEPTDDAQRPRTRDEREADAADDWRPWFPVIDYDRCVACGKCASFCLFGVYEVNPEGRVAVRNPASCKNNCPACARLCPETAIIFPKYAAGPINGGPGGDDSSGPVAVDLASLSAGDIYDTLRKRSVPMADIQRAAKAAGVSLPEATGSDAPSPPCGGGTCDRSDCGRKDG